MSPSTREGLSLGFTAAQETAQIQQCRCLLGVAGAVYWVAPRLDSRDPEIVVQWRVATSESRDWALLAALKRPALDMDIPNLVTAIQSAADVVGMDLSETDVAGDLDRIQRLMKGE